MEPLNSSLSKRKRKTEHSDDSHENTETAANTNKKSTKFNSTRKSPRLFTNQRSKKEAIRSLKANKPGKVDTDDDQEEKIQPDKLIKARISLSTNEADEAHQTKKCSETNTLSSGQIYSIETVVTPPLDTPQIQPAVDETKLLKVTLYEPSQLAFESQCYSNNQDNDSDSSSSSENDENPESEDNYQAYATATKRSNPAGQKISSIATLTKTKVDTDFIAAILPRHNPNDPRYDWNEINKLRLLSHSYQNFSVKLLTRLFDEEEIIGRNVYGRNYSGEKNVKKQPLDPERIEFIKQTVLRLTKTQNPDLAWASCVIAMNRKLVDINNKYAKSCD